MSPWLAGFPAQLSNAASKSALPPEQVSWNADLDVRIVRGSIKMVMY
jgi:hypothetical protein